MESMDVRLSFSSLNYFADRYTLMLACWQTEPRQRPTWKAIINTLDTLRTGVVGGGEGEGEEEGVRL